MKKVFIAFSLIFFISCSEHKIGYINIQGVFNDFEYKKELEKELKEISNNRKYILDSLETNLKILVKKINLDKANRDLIAEYQNSREVFLEKKSRFSDDEEMMVKKYDEKILLQLNSYVKDYGEKEKFDIIYGANSTGNIMYGDTALDITGKVVIYINEKFKGKK